MNTSALLPFLNGLSLSHIQGRKGSKSFTVFLRHPVDWTTDSWHHFITLYLNY